MTEAARDAALAVLRRLRAAGHEAYFAGGAVRDLLLGNTPQDYDVATSARPEEVTALFRRTVTVGAHFGVVVVLQGTGEVEVATFRADGAYLDGRHPTSVVWSSAEEDVQRRDFTVNALLYDPEAERVLDYVGGEADLRAGVIRAVGEARERFTEDRLRLLRAVRFAVRLGFTIEPATWEALLALAPEVGQMSAERIRDELCKMLTGPTPHTAMRLLHAGGLLGVILPEVTALADVPQPPEHHPEGDALEHTFRVVEHLDLPAPDPEHAPAWRRETLALAALLHDVGKADTLVRGPRPGAPPGAPEDHIRFPGHNAAGALRAGDIAERLRLSRAQVTLVTALVAEHDQFLQVPQMRRATRLRFLRRPHFPELLALHRADRLAGSGDLSLWERCRAERAALDEVTLHPPRLLDGNAVIALGVIRGPAVGETLRDLEDAQLEGAITTPAEAEAWVRARLSGPEPTP